MRLSQLSRLLRQRFQARCSQIVGIHTAVVLVAAAAAAIEEQAAQDAAASLDATTAITMETRMFDLVDQRLTKYVMHATVSHNGPTVCKLTPRLAARCLVA